ncbi:MAG: right-handed parallel beta-helix repeat-containing protein, partial [Pseudomonadota bacterium]|nr:right-handed parallel beta-helix repeat-containing protein [Pseudomonadota bacterium]
MWVAAGLLGASVAALAAPAWAETYHVNALTGDDRADGTAPERAWRSLARVNAFPLKPGDRVMLTAGSVWREALTLTRSGTASAPIIVAATGQLPRPRIEAGGVSPHGVAVLNAEYVTVSGLEVTNDAPGSLAGTESRFGILVSAQDRGVTRGIRIADTYVHDVRGTNARKDNGGIVFQALGPKLPTRFQGITIERNIVWRVDRSGIAGISDQVTRANWFPSEQVVIRDNLVEDVGGDGIVPRGTD